MKSPAQKIIGFSEPNEEENSDESDDEKAEMRSLIISQNRKKKKSGGFQSMGLSRQVFRAVIFKGYKVPTPIQRKSIPLIMENLDVVAMARTGSGKTAAFLIPMFEKLKVHSAKSGARALVLSPTRELALQTLKFTKELGKFCGLHAVAILGGDSMEDQFQAIHQNPDIIVATPGRLLHVLVEMELKLKSLEYVVFDEADRLFEMGFQEQLQEIINRLPDSRQTVMFSATLPKLLVDFAKAGLNDPTLIRLDVDSKLSSNLKLSFFTCRADDKPSVLLYMLNNIIANKQQTVIFAATKHHVEYLKDIITKAGLECTYIYSSLDQLARKDNVSRFQSKKCNILIVTDVAARGIDIPLLDNVINFNFPAKSKLFIHRVGRVARAGRKGHALSLISADETPYVLDLHLFLGKNVLFANQTHTENHDGVIGSVPQSIIDDEGDIIQNWHNESSDLTAMKKVCSNAYKMYLKSRPGASSESVKRAKELFHGTKISPHPVFRGSSDTLEKEESRNQLIDQIKDYKSKSTIFEVSSSGKTNRKVKKSEAYSVMKGKRNFHGEVINRSRTKTKTSIEPTECANEVSMEMSSEKQINEVFNFDQDSTKNKKEKTLKFKNEEFYIPYKAADHHTEEGLGVKNASKFEREARSAVLDLTGDDDRSMKSNQSQMKWDKKKKRYVNETGNDSKKKKFKTESGTWISTTYKSDRYKLWKTKQKQDEADDNDDEEDNENAKFSRKINYRGGKKFNKKPKSKQNKNNFENKCKKPPRHELKSKEQILKNRKKADKLKFSNSKRFKSKK